MDDVEAGAYVWVPSSGGWVEGRVYGFEADGLVMLTIKPNKPSVKRTARFEERSLRPRDPLLKGADKPAGTKSKKGGANV